jgi:hypothetical protein
MKDLVEYFNEAIDDNVYAIEDNTGAILNVFDLEKDAEDDLKNWPEESEAKVKKMKRSEIEK